MNQIQWMLNAIALKDEMLSELGKGETALLVMVHHKACV